MRRSTRQHLYLLTASFLGLMTALPIPASGPSIQPRDYLSLPDQGTLPQLPYVLRRDVGAKHLMVAGTLHLRNAGSPMYARLSATLDAAQPQVILHEGEIPAGLADLPRAQAISIGADLGFVASYALSKRIPLRSADAPLDHEISALLARHTAEDILVFLVAQRLIGGARAPDLRATGVQYPEFHANLVRHGLPSQPMHQRWEGYLRAYERVVGKPLSAATWSPDMLNPTKRSGGKLNEIVRSSERVRDRFLLGRINEALVRYDRVAVVFGGWHVLAVEPILMTMRMDGRHDRNRFRSAPVR